jgi:catechol 2,3-dioxygenase-like lactoylglutathione lyase family enzyme/predicted enzyme related to lactoylglutathione lyase
MKIKVKEIFRSRLVCFLGCVATSVLVAPGLALSQSIFTHAHMRIAEGQQADAAEWYQSIFGGEPREIGPGPIARYDNGFVGTMANEGGAGDGAQSVLDHIGMAVADVPAAVELVRGSGGKIRTGPQKASPTGPMIAHVTDPWGGRFELVEEGDAPAIHHVHLFASNADAMRDWFLKVFGGEYDSEAHTPFHRVVYDNIWVHITQVADDDPRQSSRYRAADHIGFSVPSLDAFRDKLAQSGYTPYLERPNPPGADLMFFEGPDGLHIEMTERR